MDRQERLKQLQKVQTWALKSEQAQRLEAMVKLAASEPGVAITPDLLDGDPMLLNCENGTLDLRTGDLREHRREDLITKLCPTPYVPDAKCPLWEQTLLSVFEKKAELVAYLQRLCGYGLTGDVREQILPIFWGDGSNGKSLIFKTVLRVMGRDYADVGADELMGGGQSNPHPTYLADLFGKRLVTLAETREGGRLNETLIKKLTGGELLKARRMKEDLWSFAPTHKVWLATNHKPEVRGNDHGIWRRLRLLPFNVRFWDRDKGESGPPELEADKTLDDRLKAEAEGILAWMVRGCGDWLQGGLKEPKEVTLATAAYRDEQDLIAAFLAERCEVHAAVKCRANALYAAYVAWHKGTGESGEPVSMKRFGEGLARKQIEKKTSNGVWYLGVRPTQSAPGDDDDADASPFRGDGPW
jgi:putative DNA primase/helicase